jgi:hypothetical protein
MAIKLINKGLKLGNPETMEEKEMMNSRYFHISIDKLAEAFEK